MTYRAEFLFPDLDNYVQIGGEFADRLSAIRQCYDLKGRMPYIKHYRVFNSEGQLIFSRGQPALPISEEFKPKKLLREDD